MIWLVWRRQRIQLLVALALVVLVGAAAVVGRLIADGYATALGVTPCLSERTTAICNTLVWSEYYIGYTTFVDRLGLAAVALPGIAGAVLGAPLFAAELGRGTHVFVLTQSVSRLRWWATGLLVSAVPVAVAVGLITPLVGWSIGLLDVADPGSAIQPTAFLTSGIVPTAYTILAFCLAATAGLLLRNTVGALGLALAVQVAVLATTLFLRPDYLPPDTVHLALLPPGQGDVIWNSPPDSLGVDYGYLDAQGREVSQQVAPPKNCQVSDSFSDCLRSNGYTGVYSAYQPASRYWPFQLIETGLVLALAVGALGVGLLRLRRIG